MKLIVQHNGQLVAVALLDKTTLSVQRKALNGKVQTPEVGVRL